MNMIDKPRKRQTSSSSSSQLTFVKKFSEEKKDVAQGAHGGLKSTILVVYLTMMLKMMI